MSKVQIAVKNFSFRWWIVLNSAFRRNFYNLCNKDALFGLPIMNQCNSNRYTIVNVDGMVRNLKFGKLLDFLLSVLVRSLLDEPP